MLKTGITFVFGSNLAGRHGKGAALFAKQYKGAKQGVGIGKQGSSYAIPTKDKNIKTLSLEEINKYIKDFCDYARKNPQELFELTPVGTGLAGIPKADIAIMFKNNKLPKNVMLSSTWIY